MRSLDGGEIKVRRSVKNIVCMFHPTPSLCQKWPGKGGGDTLRNESSGYLNYSVCQQMLQIQLMLHNL